MFQVRAAYSLWLLSWEGWPVNSYTCPEWEKMPGMRCHRYFEGAWHVRVVAACGGVVLGLAAPAVKFYQALSISTGFPSPLANTLMLSGLGLTVAAVVGLWLTLDHEREPWATLITGASLPALLYGWMNINSFG